MLKIVYTSKFKKDTKRVKRRGKSMAKLYTTIEKLTSTGHLPQNMKDHALIGNYTRHRECHIEPDWLLIYKIHKNTLYLERTGSHADLFKK